MSLYQTALTPSVRGCGRGIRLMLAAWACAVLPAGELVRAADDPAGDTFVVTVVDGPPFTARWVDQRDDGRTFVFAVDDAPRSFAAEDLVELRRFVLPVAAADVAASAPVTEPELSSNPFFVLAGGDRIYAAAAKATENAVSVVSPFLGTVEIPLEFVRMVVLLPPNDPSAQHQMVRLLAAHDEPNDLALLANGDTFVGTFLGLDDSTLTLETSAGEVSIDRDKLAALAMNPELLEEPDPEGLHAVVQLEDGSRLTGGLPRFENERLSFPASFGPALRFEPARIESFQILGGKVQYLSDLEPAAYRHTPYLAMHWAWLRDQSVAGRRMQLGGRWLAKGLGVHSRSELTYDLGRAYRKFESIIGIDDETEGGGSVVFRVLVDGEERFVSPSMRGDDPPEALGPIDVTDAVRLTLIVEFADHGDVLDHADWGDARLVR